MSDLTLMDLLHKAYPGRSQEELVPMGLVYAGMSWKQDYRYHDVPEYKGQPLNSAVTDGTYWFYLDWLADYLYTR